ncbi:QueT transporter family protein [Companilactobacillus sp. DQM5]|uniref:QueT transporter family protein n=1 Tax=Companilactobacillus sp. DQM5 TaxID=3463359 RepID=UPI004058D62E
MKTRDLIQTSIVAGIYIAISLLLTPFSYGPVQFRIAEMLNHFAIFDKKYIWALTGGCLVVNLFSPLAVVDVVFGTLGTLVMTFISYLLSKYVKSLKLKLTVSTITCTIFMWSIALELHIVSKIPFWMTYGTVALGELGSMVIGAVLIYLINKRINIKEMLK